MTRLGHALQTVFLLVGFSVSASAAPLIDGLLAQWDFDEFGGDIVQDGSGHGHHATLTDPSSRADGLSGQGIWLKNSRQYVNSSLAVPTANGLTLVWWMKFDSAASGTIFSLGSRTSPGSWSVQYVFGNRLLFTKDGSIDLFSRSSPMVSSQTWCELAMTWTGEAAGSSVQFYWNGRPVTNDIVIDGAALRDDGGEPFLIGGIQNGSSVESPIAGAIDGVRIYNRALTPEEILNVNDGRSVAVPPSARYTSCGADCYQSKTISVTDIQAALDASQALNGGIVWIPPVSGVLNSRISKKVTRDLTVSGSGQTKTIIDNNYPPGLFHFSVNAETFFHIKSMRINHIYGTRTPSPAIGLTGSGFKKVVSDIYFDQGATPSRDLVLGGQGDSTQGGGVVFGNSFHANNGTAQSVAVAGSIVTGKWEASPDWGSPNKWFVEDNVWNYGQDGDGALDAYRNAKFVFRHNTVNGTNMGWHGYDSDVMSTHSVEVYNNMFTTPGVAMAGSRGGTAMIWGNRFGPTTAAGLQMQYYRSTGYNTGSKGRCDGTNPVDGNQDSTGYPCYQQIGMTGIDGLTSSPMVEWDNKRTTGLDSQFVYNGNFVAYPAPLNSSMIGERQVINDTVCNDGIDNDNDGTTDMGDSQCVLFWDNENHKMRPTMFDHVKEERDFLNDTTCSDGVDNDGDGSIDMSDPQCIDFWDPVKGMAKGYTPYIYPHPLRLSLSTMEPPDYRPPVSSGGPSGSGSFARFKNIFNPAKGEVLDIVFDLSAGGTTQIAVYDRAREVRRVLAEDRPVGNDQHVIWNGRNNSGQLVASGVYVLKLTTGDSVSTKKVVVIK